MSPPASQPAGDMSVLLERVLAREDDQRDQMARIASKVSDQSNAIQGLQMELGRLVRIAERQDGYNERQIALQEQTAKHGETFDRAFAEMATQKAEFRAAFDQLSRAVTGVGDSVTGYRGALSAMKWVIGVSLPGIMGLLVFFYSVLLDKITDARQDIGRDVTLNAERQSKHEAWSASARAELRSDIEELRKGTEQLK